MTPNTKMGRAVRVWLTATFILWQFVLQVSNQEITSSSGGGMSCVCDGNCERVVESECPWGLTLDVCGCCLACARGENEPCGGVLGNCASGLSCQLETAGSASEKTGTCTKSAEKCSSGVEKFGCGVESGKCTCRVWSGCSDDGPRRLFESEDDWHAYAEEEDEDNYDEDGGDDDDCEGVECDEALECPADSHPSPRLVGPRLQRLRRGGAGSGCCASLGELCQCNPPSACPQPTCPFGSTPRLLRKATNIPGMCCPTFTCESDD